MFLNPALSAALDRIAERAGDVRRAFTPGASPMKDDVATGATSSEFTLDPLSVAGPDDAYFVVDDANSGYRYTRNGSFGIADGRLVSANGAGISGWSPAGTLGALRADPVDVALGRMRSPRIEPDGSFVYDRPSIDPRTGTRDVQRILVGRIALARFPAGTRVAPGDGQTVSAPPGTIAHTGAAGDGTFASLQPHRIVRSGVNLDESLLRLKEAYLAFDALRAAHEAKGHADKTTEDLVK